MLQDQLRPEPDGRPLWTLDVAATVEAVATRRQSAQEIIDALLARIAEIDGDLRAWVTVDSERARAAAAKIDDALLQGRRLGTLAGVAVGLKDIIDAKELPTRAGSRVLDGRPSKQDAAVVARWRRAHGIVLGKLQTSEFADLDPSPARNPWDPECTAGGSSSGPAVAVAAGTVPAALGSQTGGSTLRPAAYNGVVGLKPTFGLVSRKGIIPHAWSLDTVGIFTRSVRDSAIVLESLVGYDATDDATVRRPRPQYTYHVAEYHGPPRIGVVSDFFLANAQAEARQEVERVASILAANGAELQEIALPDEFGRVPSDYETINSAELASYHAGRYPAYRHLYGPRVAEHIERGFQVAATAYIGAVQRRPGLAHAIDEWLGRFDVVMTPSTPSAAPRDVTTTGDGTFQVPWSYCGVPAISIPSGMTSGGLPLGIQIVGTRWSEAALLAIAAWCERHLAFAARPPVWNATAAPVNASALP